MTSELSMHYLSARDNRGQVQEISSDEIHKARSIITLIVFLLASKSMTASQRAFSFSPHSINPLTDNFSTTHSTPPDAVVVFPFPIPIYIPSFLVRLIRSTLSALRILPPRPKSNPPEPYKAYKAKFPFNFVTAPITAVLFLLCIKAIGRQEVHDGIIGSDG